MLRASASPGMESIVTAAAAQSEVFEVMVHVPKGGQMWPPTAPQLGLASDAFVTLLFHFRDDRICDFLARKKAAGLLQPPHYSSARYNYAAGAISSSPPSARGLRARRRGLGASSSVTSAAPI